MVSFQVNFPKNFKDLKARYNESGRYYHTWSHVCALLSHTEAIESHLINRDSVLLAIYYHDAIYDPLSKSNEADSARLFETEMAGRIDPQTCAATSSLIIATAVHEIPASANADVQSDCAYFLDLDLSVLGTDPDIYDRYEDNIRREYAMVPDEMYNAGRAAILTTFLERERIYFTDHFHDSWERRARSNLSKAIKALAQ